MDERKCIEKCENRCHEQCLKECCSPYSPCKPCGNSSCGCNGGAAANPNSLWVLLILIVLYLVFCGDDRNGVLRNLL